MSSVESKWFTVTSSSKKSSDATIPVRAAAGNDLSVAVYDRAVFDGVNRDDYF